MYSFNLKKKLKIHLDFQKVSFTYRVKIFKLISQRAQFRKF